MIITKTPLRISFFGGGTDYPDFYNRIEGEVLVTSIDKYSYIFLDRLSDVYDFNIRSSYSKIDSVINVDDIRHPSIRNCIQYLDINDRLDISYIGDIPAKTGMGSSSSFTVGLLNALYTFKKKSNDKLFYGEKAIHVEQNVIKENVGSQDQMSTAVGGLNHIIFNKNGITVNKIDISDDIKKQLNENLVLFYYGNKRFANDILDEQISKTKEKVNDDILLEMKKNVGLSIQLLKDGKLDDFGNLMGENWQLKKKLSSKISNSGVDDIYDLAMSNGALGGKLLGAGSGGFILLYIPKENQYKIEKLINLKRVNFKFEEDGTTIIYND